ncbi:peptide chain release factor N(5)-glutamine methyltransferase [Mycoplasma sp. 4013]
MPTKADLLLEKRRYGLDQNISSFEEQQLETGMPVQKIIGYIEMADVKIDLRYKVLIPRYETEELILYVKKMYPKNAKLRILDLCCGSGFIGLALKKYFVNSEVILSDISDEAIMQSNLNKKINNLEVKIINCDLFDSITGKFDVIVSNPPYLSTNEKLDKSVLNFEPHNALFADNNGLYFYQQIIKKADKYLKNEAKIFFEINPLHLNWWNHQKWKYDIKIINDIANKPRIVEFAYKKPSNN